MSRIEPIDPNDAEPRVKAVLDAQARQWGAPLANHLIYAHRPSIFKGARGMWGGLDESGLLSGRLVALVNRRVAAHIGCVFWQDINAAVGSKLGLSQEQLLAVADVGKPLSDSTSADLFDAATLAALNYADSMTVGDVSDQQFASLSAHFSELEVVELTAVIAWENASARFNRAMRVESQELWS